MTLNINLIVHGVPMGQKIWGPKGDDRNYIASFYGPNWDVPEVMKIDIMTFGGITYCYYSFVKGQNVFDSQGRAGSYFALTLRINAFYADIQNIFGILKAAYDKMCVGLCVSETNGSAKYLLSDFQIIDSKLKEIESHILSYIREFSVGDDIINLSSFSVKEQRVCQNINLHECTKNVALEQLRLSGKLIVSPWFLSESATKTLAQCKADIQTTIEKAHSEIKLHQQASKDKISLITKQFQDELRIIKEQSNKQLTQLKGDCERKITEIKESYADIDAKLNKQKQTIKDLEKETSDLKSQCRQKDKEIQSQDQQITKLQDEIVEMRTDGYNQYLPTKTKKIIYWNRVAISGIITLVIGLLVWLALHFFNRQKDVTTSSMDDKSVSIIIKPNDSIIIKPNDSIKVGQVYYVSIEGLEDEDSNGIWESNEFTFINNYSIMAKRDYAGKTGIISYKKDDKGIASIEVNIKE